jgi:hypothetical protein
VEYTIPLVITLFGSERFITPTMYKFLSALPHLNNFEKAIYENISINFEDYFFTKENGLLFLHALTASSQVESLKNYTVDRKSFTYTLDDEELVKKILSDFEDFRQVDAKRDLPLLSRRPFFLMWKQLNKNPSQKITTFRDIYEERILKSNALYSEEVPKHFPFINYAAEHYDVDTRKRKNLSYLGQRLWPIEEIRERLDPLLKKGIISTSMLRLSPTLSSQLLPLFSEYFIHTLTSVDNPTFSFIFDIHIRG